MGDSPFNGPSPIIFIIMIELLNNYLHIIILYFPLGAIGIYRWSVWIIKKVVAKKYKFINENGYSNTLSIVVPVYNEDPNVFERALESWINNRPDEIIAVIDYTDKICIEKFKEFQKENKNSKLIITEKPGKRKALADGIKIAQYNIIALVDSDTIWDPNIKNTLLFPFDDSLVGGVGPRQDVLETNTLARRLFNIHLDHRYFDEMTYLATVGDALTCISGRTALYRKEAIKDLCNELENETFWGVKCISGDDKCITRLVQEKGWKVRYQANVRVLTPGAPDLLTFFKQQIRWTRNSYRSDLKSLMGKWIWKREKFLAYHMIDRFTQPFTLILGPIYFIFSIVWGHWLISGILLIWWHLSRGIKLYPHLKHRPSDILILPFYIFTTYLIAILKIYVLITIRQQGWITRWDKSRLQVEVNINNILRLFKLIMPHFAIASIIILLSFGIVKYKNVVAVPDYNGEIKSNGVENIIVDNCDQTNLNNLEKQQFGYYTIEKDDKLSVIAEKYNSSLLAIIKANKDIISDPDYIKIGQRLKIPALELQNALKKEKLISFKKSEITFDESSKTIYIDGKRSTVTLPKIYNVLNNKSVLEKLDNKEWLLKANLIIRKGVTLVIDNRDVSWLKLKSDKNGFIGLQSNNGNILIENTKITSWDEENQVPDANYEDGRSFILARQNGRMDVINSELSFLGYDDSLKSGIVWHTTNKPDNYLITGQILNSKFYNNYSSIYLSSTTEMMIINNEIAHNIQYGIDIRNKSTNNLLIKNNWLYDNGKNNCTQALFQ
ncbi:MAG: Glycosyl transferase family 2 [Candidatus Nomurabacteria bacterium GW2011_GWB1_35_20]|uniref:Glycosyl transferase family 2 n=3 Tax=Candidatus Nomuraibacteriota TaxID=1752729 RepID=A0A0G0GF22_9BACT|nr:MAG: Glycosyl transferase family 2 [Candidatus Nomurabacteria bacterium GW2011_GWB1_35_20]KKP75594.1 MAG: Glycosyl transferase family 2 [Parcubacteria group bacterium GW2011_GWC1_35_21]KKP78343.1 MAG: Glycosyl transferase family 2 [Candidatus Nomurabacteria bacterium GW2011_GWC2_35_35]KKP85286.1 MAG: Glycosyl transferase family 2 [Parcubacteria group bacterium GW2011_GWD2_35_7]KKP88669.1 MAG: Glycosyl transferase family 2 [Candidatus Nomurabacteria bacterium GW2011_GWA2_35_80]KKP98435.1 MAG